MRPICVPCHRFFKPQKTGFFFIEGMAVDYALPGLAETEKWQPYKLWSGDLWVCPGCKAQIISGVPGRPVAEHYESDFAEQVKDLAAEFQVNDC